MKRTKTFKKTIIECDFCGREIDKLNPKIPWMHIDSIEEIYVCFYTGNLIISLRDKAGNLGKDMCVECFKENIMTAINNIFDRAKK